MLLPCLALPANAVISANLPIIAIGGEGEIYAVNENGERYAPKAEYADEIVSAALPELIPVFC